MPISQETLDLLERRAKGSAKPSSPGDAVRIPSETIQQLQQRVSEPPDRAISPPLGSDTLPPEPEPPALRQFRDAPAPSEEPSIFGKAFQRLMGTDVDDPQAWPRIGTTIAGGLAGAAVGARVPGPPVVRGVAAAAGSVVGTAVGAIQPELIMEELEALGFVKPGTREESGLTDEQLLRVMEGEALLDAFTLGGVSAARLTARGIIGRTTGATRASRALAEDAARMNIAMLPVQVGEGQFARGFVSVMGRFPWVAGPLKRRAYRSLQQIGDAFRGIPEQLGPVASMSEQGAELLRDANGTAGAIARTFDNRISDILRQAGFNGVVVNPVGTRQASERILRRIASETPTGTRGQRLERALSSDLRDVRDFVMNTTSQLSEGAEMATPSMRQMYTLLKTIDQRIAAMGRRNSADGVQMLDDLRTSVMTDLFQRTSGRDAQRITNLFREADLELTYTIDALFNTATARKMGINVSPIGRRTHFQGLGRVHQDSLANVLLRQGSVEAVDELAALTRPQTMRGLTASYISKAIDESVVNVGRGDQIAIEKFVGALGLDSPRSTKFLQTEALLGASGGLTMDQLRTLTEITRRASQTEIPDVSTFIARGATIGGLERLVTVVSAFSLQVGATALAGSTGFGTGLLLIGGSRVFGNMISDPKAARALSRVLDQEASVAVKRAAAIRAFTFGVTSMMDSGQMSYDEARAKRDTFINYADEFTRRYEKRRQQDAQ